MGFSGIPEDINDISSVSIVTEGIFVCVLVLYSVYFIMVTSLHSYFRKSKQHASFLRLGKNDRTLWNHQPIE